jgi:hypothetical protein
MNNKNFNKSNSIISHKVIDLYKFLNKKEFFELARRMNINNIKIQKEGQLLKFRRWGDNWELPKEIKIKEESIKYKSSRKNQNIIKRTVWAKIERLENFQKRWSSDKAQKYWGNQAKIPYTIKDKWIWCKIHDNWISNFRLGTEFVYNNKWIYFKIPKGYIGISYDSRDYHNNFTLVPNRIKADDFFFEGLGLQQGDGTQSLSNVHVTFTNGCYELIEHQLQWFYNLNINLNSIRIYPEIPPDKKEEFNNIKKKLISIGIKEHQFRKGKSKLINTKNVLIQLVFHNKLFKVIYLNLLQELKCSILVNKHHIKPYLKGLLAAEGCVRLRKQDNVLNDVKISASKKTTRNFIKKCLMNINIIPSKDELTKGSEAIIIRRYENFLKLREFNALDLHPKKQEKFINGLRNYKNRGVKYE